MGEMLGILPEIVLQSRENAPIQGLSLVGGVRRQKEYENPIQVGGIEEIIGLVTGVAVYNK